MNKNRIERLRKIKKAQYELESSLLELDELSKLTHAPLTLEDRNKLFQQLYYLINLAKKAS